MGWCRERSRKFLERAPESEDMISWLEDPDEEISAQVYYEPTEHTATQTDIMLLETEPTAKLISQLEDRPESGPCVPAMRVTRDKSCNGALRAGRALDARQPGLRGSTRNRGYRTTGKVEYCPDEFSYWANENYDRSFLDDIQLCDVDAYTLEGEVDWRHKGASRALVKDYDAPEVKYSLRSRDVVKRDKVLAPTSKQRVERSPIRRGYHKSNREAVLTDNTTQTRLRVDTIRLQCFQGDGNSQ